MKNIQKSQKNNKFKTSASTWNDEFELTNGYYSISDTQDHFEYVIKNHETFFDNPPTQMYAHIIENRITFKIKTESYLELLTSETMKLHRST